MTVAAALESQSGDPNLPEESLSLGADQIDAINQLSEQTGLEGPPLEKKVAQVVFAQRLLEIAGAEADDGVSRNQNRPRVTEYLNLLGLDFADGQGTAYPFCAAGLSWATVKSFCDMAPTISYSPGNRLQIFKSILPDIRSYYFKPDARCQAIVDDARSRGTWVTASEVVPKSGWLISYNWHRQSHAEHIGIVQSADASTLHMIEFNTTADDGPNQGNGGFVARKNRQPFRWAVLGYVKTY